VHEFVDHSLLMRTARGDDAAARTLWAIMGPRLIALAKGLMRSHGGEAAALDVVQTVFCRVLDADRSTLADVKDVAAWLARGVRNESLNHHRETRRREANTAASQQMARAAASVSDGAQDAFAELNAALDSLPESLREIVLLKHAAGLTFDQIAISLDDNRSTVASRYAKALKLLREGARRTDAREPREVYT
jgi:RNA polymerase sigma-70 factor (ECF subfamily)